MNRFTKHKIDDDEKVAIGCASILIMVVIIFLGWLIWYIDHTENTPDVGDIVAFKTEVLGGATDGIVIEVVELKNKDMYTVSYRSQKGEVHQTLSRKKDLVIIKKKY